MHFASVTLIPQKLVFQCIDHPNLSVKIYGYLLQTFFDENCTYFQVPIPQGAVSQIITQYGGGGEWQHKGEIPDPD